MLEGLNEKQSEAAGIVNGPVIVYAGAGSGKTRTLTYRILNMIAGHGIDPGHILAITFTNKATRVMRERLGAYPEANVPLLTICTIHSLCARILRRDIDVIGYDRNFDIVDEEEQMKVIAEIRSDFQSDSGLDRKIEKNELKNMRKMINHHKCFMQLPENERDRNFYLLYEKKMKEMNLLDFEDLLLKTEILFRTHPEVLFRYQEKYRYLLVDEFQDTNLAQYKIIAMLAGRYRNLFAVGDDDQSIYGFRGTNYDNPKLFRKDFPEFKSFTLAENYRSTQTILDYANRLIANNRDRIKKEMHSDIKGTPDDVEICAAIDQNAEVDFIADKIKSSSGDYREIAVLYRSSVLLRNLEKAFMQRKIPYKVYGGISYLSRREVKDIIAYFKLMLNHGDRLSFRRIVNTPNRGIGEATVSKIEKIAMKLGCDYYEAIESINDELPSCKIALLKEFREMMLKYEQRLSEGKLQDIFDDLVEETGYYEFLGEEYDEANARDRKENLKEFKSILYSIENEQSERSQRSRSQRERSQRERSLRTVFDEAVLADDKRQSRRGFEDGVTLSTIHSIKGLEYDTVFLMGLEEGLFPSYLSLNSEKETEEERRVAYVAMTRPRKKLYLSWAVRRLLYGKICHNFPSRFLTEAIGGEQNLSMQHHIENLQNRFYRDETGFVYRKPADSGKSKKKDGVFEIGAEVLHDKFGKGVILGIENGRGKIFFYDKKETKLIVLSHPALRKRRE